LRFDALFLTGREGSNQIDVGSPLGPREDDNEARSLRTHAAFVWARDLAAPAMNSATSFGLASMATWLQGKVNIFAPIRFAVPFSCSGEIARSLESSGLSLQVRAWFAKIAC
jgi:hypothetical protein